jgi:bifunctional UDP-N-acetylglucosamine pyrophosphorylase/glucosamine-1-phosphate N-acetyltransferase
VAAGYTVGVAPLDEPEESLGVNSRADLAHCHAVLNRRTLNRLMADGVTILDPASTFIAPEVVIGADTTILPGCFLQGEITIGRRGVIGPYTSMSGRVFIGDDVRVTYSVVRDSRIGSFSTIGPFAQLRDGVDLSHHVHIGNFVEVKKTRIDHHTNAAHLSYLGDAELGTEVNIGAGTITANFDPIREIKSVTRIEDGVKIGSNSVLVAPVTVGETASVAAGSVITRDVPPGDLAIARARQTEIPGWVRRVKGQQPSVPSSQS